MRPLFACLFVATACTEFSVQKTPEPIVEPEDSDTDLPDAPAATPDIDVQPAELDFGYLPKDCAAEPQKVTITNVGDADLDVSSVIISGPDAPVYTLTVNPRTLAPGESFKATVGFTPTAWVDFNRVKLEIDSNDPDEGHLNVGMFGAGAEDAVHEQVWLQTTPNPVDVLWVIDNSCSMDDDLTTLANSFHTFINSFINLGLDFHIAVTTTDMTVEAGRFVGDIIDNHTPDPVQEFRDQTTQGATGSGDEKGRDAAYAALTPPLITGHNSGFLRGGANLAVVTVSDEDDASTGVSVNAFNNWLDNLKGDPLRTSFSGMVGPDNGAAGLFQPPACSLFGGGSATYAPRYHDLIRGTKGEWSDFCQFDINPFLNFLAYLAAGLLFEFPLDFVPSSPGDIDVLVDGNPVSYSAFNGWTYDPGANSVKLNGASIPGPGAVITISYPFTTTCQ